MTGTGCSGRSCPGRRSTGPAVTLATLPHVGQAPAPPLNLPLPVTAVTVVTVVTVVTGITPGGEVLRLSWDCNFNGVTPETEGDTSDRRDRGPGPGRGR